MSLPNLLNLNFLLPFVAHKIDFSRAIRGLLGMPRRVLLLTHKVTAGTAATNALIRNISSESDAVGYFGEGSMGVLMWRAAKRAAGLGLPIDAIVVPTAGGGVAATSLITFTNSGANLSSSGEVMLYIGGVRVSIGVSTADTNVTVAAALVAAINAIPSLPVTAVQGTLANTNQITLTARWAGPNGNDIDVRSVYYPDDRIPNGLTITIAAMSGGAGNPDITAAIAAMAGYRATEIVMPFNDSTNIGLLEAELAARWLFNNMQDAQAVTAARFADEASALTWFNSRNSEQVHSIPTIADCTNPFETAALAGAALEALAAVDPAVPPMGVALPGYLGPVAGKHWNVNQMNDLLQAGGSPLVIHTDYTAELSRMVTNYEHNPSNGAADRSKSSYNWIKTMSYWRWSVVNTFQNKYMGGLDGGFKIAEYVTEPIPGQKIMTADLGQEVMIGIYNDFCKAGLMQNLPYYKDSITVEVDGPNGKLKIIDYPVLITQHYQTEITSYPIAGHV